MESVEAGSIKTQAGAKGQQRADKYTANRQGNYSRWRYEITESPEIKAHGLYSTDFDFVEWSFNWNGDLVAAAVIDATQADNTINVSDTYLESILKRFNTQMQGKCLTFASTNFRCNSYILLFRQDCSEFWLYNWTEKKGWKYMTREEHIEWLIQIHKLAKSKT